MSSGTVFSRISTQRHVLVNFLPVASAAQLCHFPSESQRIDWKVLNGEQDVENAFRMSQQKSDGIVWIVCDGEYASYMKKEINDGKDLIIEDKH